MLYALFDDSPQLITSPRSPQNNILIMTLPLPEGRSVTAAGQCVVQHAAADDLLEYDVKALHKEPSCPSYHASTSDLPAVDSTNDVESVKKCVLDFLYSQLQDKHPLLLQALGLKYACVDVDEICSNHAALPQLAAQWMAGGSTNYCFKVHAEGDDGGKSIFIKYAPGFARAYGEDAHLPQDRVEYEYHGLTQMGKHAPDSVPRIIMMDKQLGILVSEYLEGYSPLSHHLAQCKEEADKSGRRVAQEVSTVMGRLHASTMGDSDLCSRYLNLGHISFWDKVFFGPINDVLREPHSLCSKKPYLVPLLQSVSQADNKSDSPCLITIISMVQTIYESKKEALVHADLHSCNVLYHQCSGDLKVVDAEKFFAGPCGLDVGLWLSNYVWYFAVWHAADDKCGVGMMEQCIMNSWISYAEAFYAMTTSSEEEIDEALQGVFTDTLGFLGTWMLFMAVAAPVDILGPIPLTGQELYTAQESMLRISAESLRLFYVRTRASMSKALPSSAYDISDLLNLVRTACEDSARPRFGSICEETLEDLLFHQS